MSSTVWNAPRTKKHPYLAHKHWHKVIDGEDAMNAENVRIEAEARELVKRRPFGPWFFS
jgi:predicted DNA-binding protein (MmcQ/YjbR family)